MTQLLTSLAAYVPFSIIQATLANPDPLPQQTVSAESFPAAILFADVSGFTPLTEALAKKGLEGPEELTRLLNGYFSRMIALIEAEGGEVVKFSGDALTVVFAASPDLGQATRRAKQAAEAMQAAMQEFTTLQTSVGKIELGMKIGIGAGEIIAARVGGVGGRWEYIIAGDPIRQVAEAEHHAEKGQIILSPEAAAIITPMPLAPTPLSPPDWSQVQHKEAVEMVLKGFVPSAVATWLEGGLGNWLAVLRPMTVLFIGIGGLDYQQPQAIEQLHEFLCAAQTIIQKLEGSINKVAVDDKGTVLIALFGAPPYAHENDPERGVRCALELQKLVQRLTRPLQLAIGVTTGRVFTGPVGSDARREYTVMGDTVNLAARFMVNAGMGQIRCDYETYRTAQHHLIFETLPSITVKGKAGQIRIYRPTGIGKTEQVESKLIGRRAEMSQLEQALTELQAGQSHVVLVEGEAGIGKSRLVSALRELTQEHGVAGLIGAGYSIEQQTPYRAWRDIFTSYFNLDEVTDLKERQQLIQSQVQEVLPELAERLPLLNDILHLGLPENSLTTALDAHLRHESLVSLLLALLKGWAIERPMVLVLEDAHWLDTLSWELTSQVARTLVMAHVPILLVVVMRPVTDENATSAQVTMLKSMAETVHLPLNTLSPDEIVALMAARLSIAVEVLPAPIVDLIRDRSGGNPFFAEELLNLLRENKLLSVENGACVVEGDLTQAISALPDTLQGIVLSRIDRLKPSEQFTLKVGSVIGRTFAFSMLLQAMKVHTEVEAEILQKYLDNLTHLDLTPQDTIIPELIFIFKHIITQEVAYSTLLFAQRRQLHRTMAELTESQLDKGTSTQTQLYPMLVHHWHNAGDEAQERQYAWLAGEAAAAQFANDEAIRYFSRALELTPLDDMDFRYQLLLAREAVNDLRGERVAQAQDLAELTTLVDQLNNPQRRAIVALRCANYAEATSDYEAALHDALAAIDYATQTRDQVNIMEGHIAWGKSLWRQGQYEEALIPLQRALALARALSDQTNEAKCLSHLGDVYLYQNDYPAAESHFRQAIDLYHALGRRQEEANSLGGLAVVYNDLGDYVAACKYNEQVLDLYRSIGYRRGEAIVLNNLGVNYCDLGSYALAENYLHLAKLAYHTINDTQGELACLANLSLVFLNLGNYEIACEQAKKATIAQKEIGDKRFSCYSLTYLGHALIELSEYEEATKAFTEARDSRRELGQDSLAIDDVAGLARVALLQGQMQTALEQVNEILAWIERHGIAGIEYPLQVYESCYQVLQAMGQTESAKQILNTAYNLLMQRAEGISDVALRQSFLENIKAHREIRGAYQELGIRN